MDDLDSCTPMVVSPVDVLVLRRRRRWKGVGKRRMEWWITSRGVVYERWPGEVSDQLAITAESLAV